jgi:hypothetical protein
MTRPHAGDLRVDAEDGCAVDDWDAIAQGTPGLACTGLARSDLVLGGDGPAPVFRTEVICQNVPSLDKPVSPLAWSSCADPAQTIRGAERLH